jgi:uroporphyrinogen decarboxylase
VTSKERVLAAFEHTEPDRVPRWCGASAEFLEKAKGELNVDEEGLRRRFGDDFRRVYSRYSGPQVVSTSQTVGGPEITWVSPFGVARTGIGYGQPLSHPLAGAATVAEILDFPWPEADWIDVSDIRRSASPWSEDFAILGGEWAPFWHDAIDLVGHEQLYYLMYDYPEVAEKLLELITDYYYLGSERTFEEAGDLIDVFFIGNDLGSQTGPLLGTDLFRRFLLPQFERLIDLGHRYGLKVMMHCCGGFRPLIPDLIEAGMDGLHALQPDAAGMDPAGLKRDFGDKILLNGSIDSKHILIEGKSPEWVREQTHEILRIMAPGGGYVASASHDTILEETPVENVLAMFDAVEDFDLL